MRAKMKTYNLSFTEDELNGLFKDLGECRYREVFRVMRLFEKKIDQGLNDSTERAYEVGQSHKLDPKKHRTNGRSTAADS
jgi:hypothetical protein